MRIYRTRNKEISVLVGGVNGYFERIGKAKKRKNWIIK